MEAEQHILALQTAEFRPTILRMATIYGRSPRMRFDLIVNTLALHTASRGKITVFGGDQWRPLVHVSDAARAYVMCLGAPLSVVGGQIFNVGSNEQNYQIKTLGALVRQTFPEVQVETIPRSPDLRDYHVVFDKITGAIGYKVRCTVDDGLREIVGALEQQEFGDPRDPKYYNVPPA
jgi:nucleoside-diphosphate-sugar epimerase